MRQRSQAGFGASLFTLLLVLAVGACGWLIGISVATKPVPPIPVARSSHPELVASGLTSYDGGFDVSVVGRFVDGDLITGPAWVGLVTATDCASGSHLADGATVVEVDGVLRRAAHTAIPFYRRLAVGDEGRDVVQLRSVYRSQGIDVPSEGPKFDREMRDATRLFAKSIASPDRSGAFDPSWLVWLPSPDVVVQKCKLAVGSRLTGGEVVAQLPESLVEVEIVTDKTDIVAGALQLTTKGVSVPLVRDPLAVDPTAIVSLDAALTGRPHPNGATEAIPARVMLIEPIKAAVVPVTALYASGTATCLVATSVENPDVIPVSILESRAGSATVMPLDSTEQIPGTVVANSSDIDVREACKAA